MKGLTLVEANTETPRPARLAGGTAFVYSAPSPTRDGPNQDAAAVIPWTEDSGIIAVADGVGGGPGGAEASRLCVESLAEALEAARGKEMPLRAAIMDGIDQADARIAAAGRSAGLTTVAVVAIEAGTARSFHAGDSEILIVGQRGKLKHQVIAHGPVGYAVEAGVLDEQEAIAHEERNVVSNVVGTAETRIEVGPPIRLASRDTVLVATDGLSDNLYVNEIVERIRKGDQARSASALAEAARQRMAAEPAEGLPSKPDDLTFIVFRGGTTR